MTAKKKNVAVVPTVQSANGDAYFVGAYVPTLRDALVASAISGQSAIVLSPPGTGKTDIAMSMANDIAPKRNVFSRLSPATPAEKITGLPDPAKALGNPPVIEYVVGGTPYDPDAQIIVLDEFGRTNDIVFDLLLDVLDRQDIDPDNAPTVWATSNFSPTTDRTEALRDRFAFWVWLDAGNVDVAQAVRAHMIRKAGSRLRVPNFGSLPTLADIQKIKMSRANDETISVVARFIEVLSTEAAEHGFFPNYRRVTQWQSIVYRAGVYYSGDPNFTVVHSKAADALRWCWPTQSKEEASKWSTVVGAIADVVGTAIDSLMADAFQKFKEIGDNVRDRVPKIQKLGAELARVQSDLEKIAAGDPRIDDAVDALTRAYSKALSGGNPLE